MYQALYRKYRPKSFDDVVGQEHITQTLKREIVTGKVAHAYLFCGSRGTGKTTCAKILAKAVNCPNLRDGNPCGECEICRGIDDGSIMDVLEIDAASNNGVDNVRQLREDAFFTPSVAKYRVYIIDETHMLSTGAFNALLKIMEEPPSHVLFILATTEAHKVPATILSRCQRFDFHRIKSEDIAGYLEKIAGKEDVELHHEGALLIGRLSDGGMRDAVSLLDQCVSQGKHITAELVSRTAGLAGSRPVLELAGRLAAGDAGAALEMLAQFHQQSVDMTRLCEELISHYRDLMIFKTAQNPENLVFCLPEEAQILRSQADGMKMPAVLYGLTVLQDAMSRMGRSVSRRTELEIAVIRLCSPAQDTSMDAVLTRLDALEAAMRAGTRPAPARQKTAAPEVAESPAPSPEDERAQPPSPASGTVFDGPEPDPFPDWQDILERLKKSNPPLAAALKQSEAYVRGDLILIDAKDELFFKLVRQNDFAKKSLRDALQEQTGRLFRLGPYKRPAKAAQQEQREDPLDRLAALAADAGISVENE
ncbi:MAG: DNA polymerase III subunit gamma/tau [Oscillospiraceae bacterium]|nr:DNA polymerase III subunit gamma/tau [Oscillospiraceae bacterium]